MTDLRDYASAVEVRTADVVGALGLATDLGMRAAFGHSLRTDIIRAPPR